MKQASKLFQQVQIFMEEMSFYRENVFSETSLVQTTINSDKTGNRQNMFCIAKARRTYKCRFTEKNNYANRLRVKVFH